MRLLPWTPVLLALLVLSALTPARAGYMLASASVRDADNSLTLWDNNAGQDTANTSFVEYARSGGSAYSRAAVDFNYLGAEAFATGPATTGAPRLSATGNARQVETFHAFDSLGNELSEGTLVGYFRVDGSVSGNAEARFSWEHRNDPEDEGGNSSHTQWGNDRIDGPSITIDELIPFIWPLAVGGVEVQIDLYGPCPCQCRGPGRPFGLPEQRIDRIDYLCGSAGLAGSHS